MAIDFTTTALISNLKRRILLPSAQILFSDEELVAFMSDELMITCMTEIKKAKKEFFVKITDVPIVAGQTTYSIPQRAYSSAIRDFSFLDVNNNEFNCPHLIPEVVKDGGIYGTPGNLYGAYFQGDQLIVYTGTSNPTSIRIRWERRPNNLALSSQSARITAINTGLNQVTVASVPSGVFSVGTEVDFINNNPPFDSKGDDYPITGILANVFTFSGGLPTGIAINNYIAPSGKSPVAQVPYELHLVISQLGASKVLQAKGDQNWQNERAMGNEMLSQFIQSISPRVEGSPNVITNRRGIWNQGRAWLNR